MEVLGKVYRDDRFWLAEVEDLDLLTQGKTRKEAIAMLEDAVTELLNDLLSKKTTGKFSVAVKLINNKGELSVRCTQTKFLLALILRRQREKNGLTVRNVMKAMGAKSPTAYARYEKAQASPSIETFELLLGAVSRGQKSMRLY